MALRRVLVATVLGSAVVAVARTAVADSYLVTGKGSWVVGTSESEGYQTSDASQRGGVVVNGTSLGAYTVFPDMVSFENVATNGDYDSVMYFSSTVLDDPTANATFSYMNGTAGMSDLPFSWEVWLPSPTVVGGFNEFTLTGAISLGIKVTNTSTYTTYQAGGGRFRFPNRQSDQLDNLGRADAGERLSGELQFVRDPGDDS